MNVGEGELFDQHYHFRFYIAPREWISIGFSNDIVSRHNSHCDLSDETQQCGNVGIYNEEVGGLWRGLANDSDAVLVARLSDVLVLLLLLCLPFYIYIYMYVCMCVCLLESASRARIMIWDGGGVRSRRLDFLLPLFASNIGWV